VDGKIIKELIEKKTFVPIEAAPDPEVCRITDDGLFLGSQVSKKLFPEQ
jgi:hypothetical protein